MLRLYGPESHGTGYPNFKKPIAAALLDAQMRHDDPAHLRNKGS